MPLERNKFIHNNWVLEPLVDLKETRGFDCGKLDLNNYFHFDIVPSERLRLSKTFKFYPIPDPGAAEPTIEDIPTVGLVSFANDALDFNLGKSLPHVPRGYRGGKLPAVKICRLAVDKAYHDSDIGTHLLNITKVMFCTDNRTGCRIVTVDAYNDLETLAFYDKNGFAFLTDSDEDKDTRTMYFDLYFLRHRQSRLR